jgi:hypothetical protein
LVLFVRRLAILPSTGIPNALRAMNRLATSSILTFAFVAFSIGGFAGVRLCLPGC